MDALERLQKIDRKAEIKGWRIQMYFWTRSPKLLFLASAIIIGLGVCGAWFSNSGGSRKGPAASIGDPRQELAKPHPDAGRIITMIGYEGISAEEEAVLEEWVAKSTLATADKTVLLTFARDLQTGMDEPSAEMLYYAHLPKPLQYANSVVAGYYRNAARYDKAAVYYQREYDNYPSRAALTRLVALLLQKKDVEALKKLEGEPDFLASISFDQKIIMLPRLGRWDLLLQPLIAWEKSMLEP